MKKYLSLTFALVILLVALSSVAINGVAESVTHLYGDVNDDDSVDLRDVLFIRKHLASIKVEVFNFQACDVNQDSCADMKDVLLIRKHIAHVIDLGSYETEVTKPTTTTTALEPKYPIDHTNPRINFIEGSKATLGVWWWHQIDGDLRTELMELLEANQVTEIYYCCDTLLGSSSGNKIIHEFVQEAMKHHMRVAVLFEVQGVVNEGNNSFKLAVDNFNKYKATEEYKDDDLYGFHCDIEPQARNRVSDTAWQTWFQGYVSNFLPQVQYAREQGIWVELDLGCGWNTLSRKVTYTGGFTDRYKELVNPEPEEDGTYSIKLFDAIANSCDVMCMMSYRDTATEILSFGSAGRVSADKAGIKIIYGIETGNAGEGEHVDFYSDSKEIAYTELSKVLVLLERNSPVGEYGLAIHHMDAWYVLRDVLKE